MMEIRLSSSKLDQIEYVVMLKHDAAVDQIRVPIRPIGDDAVHDDN